MPASGKEREIKLLVPADFEMPPLDSGRTGVASVVEADPLDLTASYFDTPDFRLLSYGISVRVRTGEGNGPVWTVKLPVDGDPTLRSELNYTAEGLAPPAEIVSLLRSLLLDDPLNPVAEMKTRRRVWHLLTADGGQIAELVDDRVSILEGNQIKDSFREIEVEARAAGNGELKKIARVIEKAGAKPEQRSKVSRALEAVQNGAKPVAEPSVSPADPVSDAARVALSRLMRNMLARAPHALLGEPEGVHRMRVGQRRLRSVLRAFGPLIDTQKTAHFVEELRWLGVVLGDVRDLDVFSANLRAEVGDNPALVPLFTTIASRSEAAQNRMKEAFNTERYFNLIREASKLISDDDLVTAEGTVQTDLLPLAGVAASKLRKAARALTPESPEAEFHEVRKLAKRARYTADLVSEFVKPRDAKLLLTFAAHMTGVQDSFGEHQDATLARDTLIGITTEHPTNASLALEIGRLVERADRKAADLRKLCLQRWNKLDKDKSTKWPRT